MVARDGRRLDRSRDHGLVAAFVRGLQPNYVLEIGTAFGQTARAIGKALKRNRHGELDTLEVDPARGHQAKALTRRLPVRVVEEASLDFTPRGPIDLAWFDSLIDLRVDECLRYMPWMHARTVVGFHDTGRRFDIGLNRLAGLIPPFANAQRCFVLLGSVAEALSPQWTERARAERCQSWRHW
jgi:hypothetical protein